MTTPDPTKVSDHQSEDYTGPSREMIAGIGGVALLFIGALAAGFGGAVIQAHNGSFSTIDAVVLGALALAALVVVLIMRRYWPSTVEPEAQRVKRSRWLLYASLAIGAALGILLGLGDGSETTAFSDQPISQAIAGIFIAIWLTIVPVGTWLWWRSIDEHEGEAYRDGAFVAGYAYLFLVPAWWMATRAGWLPPQEPIIVFAVVCLVWTAVWFTKRYF